MDATAEIRVEWNRGMTIPVQRKEQSMSTTISTEEIVRRGKEIYDRDIRARVEEQHRGQFLVVDIFTGEYEIARNDGTASERLRARCPNALTYGVRIGSPVAYRLGGQSV